MSESMRMQMALVFGGGGVAAGFLMANISEWDKEFLFTTWAWVSISVAAFLALWQWDNNRLFPFAFIIASFALWSVWGDLEVLLEVNVIHGFNWGDRKPAPVVPFWLHDGVLYCLMISLWIAAFFLGRARLRRPF